VKSPDLSRSKSGQRRNNFANKSGRGGTVNLDQNTALRKLASPVDASGRRNTIQPVDGRDQGDKNTFYIKTI